jgi:iron complex transport system ATP-binding protein
MKITPNNKAPLKLEMKNVTLGYEKKEILSEIDFELQTGDILCLLGPNGVGKTTLLKALLGFIKPFKGTITLNNKDISQWGRKEFAQIVGYIPQTHNTPFPYKVEDVVLFGRTAHLGMLASPSKKDRIIGMECMDMLGIINLKDRYFTELSGGERQMVIIARALAQEPHFLVMDEPTSNLDFGNQVRVMKKINELKNNRLGIVMATHAPDHAFLFGSKAMFISRGKKLVSGIAEETITEEQLREVYGVDVKVFQAPDEHFLNRKVCIPII